MAAEIVVGGSGERTAVPRVCTQQRRPLRGIEAKLFTCCQSGKGSPCPFPTGQKLDLKVIKGQRPKERNIHLVREK